MLEAIAIRSSISDQRLVAPKVSVSQPSRLLPVASALGLSLLVALVLVSFREPISRLGDWSYLGVFLIHLAHNATIFLPTPGEVYIFVMGATLNPLLIGLLGGLGATLGELTGYFLGTRGRLLLQGGHLYERLQALTTRWAGAALFTFAVLPVPFDVAGIWAGTVRYPLWRFLLYVTVGKALKVTAIAMAGYYSMDWLIRLLG